MQPRTGVEYQHPDTSHWHCWAQGKERVRVEPSIEGEHQSEGKHDN